MRIDLNTQATNGVANPAGSSGTHAAGKKTGDGSERADTAQFLFDRVKAQALAPDSAQRIDAGKFKVEALRKILAEGSYSVPSEQIAGAIIAEARV
jgi:anti-sigma28 factor (negative regulator of flagellin synthesis)